MSPFGYTAVVLFLGLVSGGPEVSIRLRVTNVWKGGTLHVMCRVPRRAENRWVEAGILDFTTDARPLHGEDGPITNEFWLNYVPCGFDTVYCRVGGSDGREALAQTRFQVVGCP